jgi:hypothetical protein
MMICNVWLPKSRKKTGAILEEIITSRNEVFKDCESDMAVGIRKQGNRTGKPMKCTVIVQPNAGS